MKETIYTIPVNEAYERDEECPICYLAKKLEKEAIEYALGAAMMEPDYRTQSNEVGYCNKHFAELIKIPNKLGLALVLETHIAEIRKKTALYEQLAEKAVSAKSSVFKKSDKKEQLSQISKGLAQINSGCMICNKTNSTVDRYIDVLLYMWNKDDDFKKKFDDSKGVCLPHFEKLCTAAAESLPADTAAEFIRVLCKKQNAELERINDEVHRFTLKFDYRNRDMELGSAKDAPQRAAQKVGGYTEFPDEE